MDCYKKRPQVIDYSKDLRITNLEQLSRGTGAKFLETMRAHNGDLIAVQWRRKLVDSIHCTHILVRLIS